MWALETPGAGGASGYGGHMHRDVASLAIEEETTRAIRIAKLARDPIALDAGTYDVVIEPAAFSRIDRVARRDRLPLQPRSSNGTSPVAGRAGERVTGAGVTMVEDPWRRERAGLRPRRSIAKGRRDARCRSSSGGVAREILYDRTTASRLGARVDGERARPRRGDRRVARRVARCT